MNFISGKGEVSSFIREKDWSSTSLGSTETWPQSLRTTLSIVLNSALPMLLLWGKTRICFYNDAFRPCLGDDGKHPALLGETTDNYWGDNWETIKPMLDHVLETGETSWSQDQLLSICRDGQLEEAYWNFTYSAVNDESGRANAVLVTCVDTTSQVIRTKLLKDSEEQFRLLADNIPALSWMADASGNRYWFNKQWYAYTGTTESEMVSGGWTTVHDPEVLPLFMEKWTTSIRTGEIFEMIFPLRSASGQFNHFLTRIVPLYDDEGKIQKWFGCNTDITIQKEALDLLRANEKHFQETVKQAPIGFVIARGRDYVIELVNDEYMKIVGRREEEFVGRPYFDLYPEVKDIVKPLLDRVYDTGIPYQGRELKIAFIKHKKEVTGYFDFLYHPLREKDGTISGIIATGYEVTEQVVKRKKIEEAESKFRSLISQSPIAMVVFSGPEQIIEMPNKAMLKRWGKTENEVIGKRLHEVFPDLKGKRFDKLLSEVYRTGKPYLGKEVLSYPHNKENASDSYIDYEYSPLLDPGGKVGGVLTTVTDVTEKVYSRKSIEESEQRFSAAIQAVEGVVWTNSSSGEMVGIQQGWSELTGQSYEEYQGFGWISRVHPDDAAATVIAWNEAVEQVKTFDFEHRVKTKSGEYKSFSIKAIPILNNNGTVSQWVGVHTDIQQLKDQEQQKDYFISMASHELKTPVTSIKGYVQILQETYKNQDDGLLHNALKVMDRQVDTLVKLITELLDVSKIKLGSLDFDIEKFEISDLLDDVLNEIKHIHPSHTIQIIKEECGIIKGDYHRTSQVLINFLINAVKYAPNSKEIWVKVFCDSGFVFVSVTDKGIGIEKEDQAYIFDRFYRVEGKKERTYPGFGIGLFIAAEIIHKQNGKIMVESEPGIGSTFTFGLPLVKDNKA